MVKEGKFSWIPSIFVRPQTANNLPQAKAFSDAHWTLPSVEKWFLFFKTCIYFFSVLSYFPTYTFLFEYACRGNLHLSLFHMVILVDRCFLYMIARLLQCSSTNVEKVAVRYWSLTCEEYPKYLWKKLYVIGKTAHETEL